jgi:tetratricopeptide (TPR) repeat protein
MKPSAGKGGSGKSARLPPDPALAQMFSLAVRHHQSGRLQEAQSLYQQALALDPHHAPSLHYLGVLAMQAGRADTAVELIGRAIALEARNPESHYNIALALRALGRMDEVIAHCRRAVALKPDYADAHLNLGNALKQEGKLDEAAASYRRLAHLRRDSADAHFNLANVLVEQNKPKDAIAAYERTLALKPDHAQALNNLGTVLLNSGRGSEAVGCFQRAVRDCPELTESYINLAAALLALRQVYDACGVINRAFEIGAAHSKIEEALGLLRRALEIEDSRDTRTLFVQCMRTLPRVPDVPGMRDLLIRALDEPWGRPSDLAPAATSLIKQNAVIAAAIERADTFWPRRLAPGELFGDAAISVLAEDTLLHALLCSTFIREIAFERYLTNLRAAMLAFALTDSPESRDSDILTLCCAFARHCFINEYVFDTTASEDAQVGALRDRLAAALQAGEDIPAFPLAAVAAYFPLHRLHGAATLLQRAWTPPMRALIARQVAEPSEEQEIGTAIPTLTAIVDGVSRAVQQQYEQNPYPRWAKAAPIGRAMTLDDYLSSKFQQARLRPLGKANVDILVAGCGTGQHSALLAQQFPQAKILAIDLSRASLSYAARTTRALQINNVEYAQADIMQLGSLDRSFDAVDSSGVLHHLADPLAGWRVLLSLLRPGGVMRLGLYSELGRRDIEVVRRFVGEQGYRPEPDVIRKARQHLATFPPESPQRRMCDASDFYSLSECRDLLWHVQEKSFTLAEIKAFLAAEDLTFLGFEVGAGVSQLYARKFPADAAMNDLDRWQVVETENPRIFFNMYQFWLQKPA